MEYELLTDWYGGSTTYGLAPGIAVLAIYVEEMMIAVYEGFFKVASNLSHYFS